MQRLLDFLRESICGSQADAIRKLEERVEVLEARLKATRLALWKAATCVPEPSRNGEAPTNGE
jgi:hypothetical protein